MFLNIRTRFSAKVATTVLGLARAGEVAIRISGYRCECCKRLGTLALDNKSCVERGSYRLKRLAGSDNGTIVY